MASMDFAETTARGDEKHLRVVIWCTLYQMFDGIFAKGVNNVVDSFQSVAEVQSVANERSYARKTNVPHICNVHYMCYSPTQRNTPILFNSNWKRPKKYPFRILRNFWYCEFAGVVPFVVSSNTFSHITTIWSFHATLSMTFPKELIDMIHICMVLNMCCW